MKKSSLKLSTFTLALSMGMTILALPSCKSIEHTITDTHNLSLVAHTSHHDTVLVHDSIFIREVQKGDTVFRDRIQYRDRWRTHIVHDTVLKTDSIVQVIEHPPERFIPPFYKHCTVILWIILAAGIVWIVGKWYIKWKI